MHDLNLVTKATQNEKCFAVLAILQAEKCWAEVKTNATIYLLKVICNGNFTNQFCCFGMFV